MVLNAASDARLPIGVLFHRLFRPRRVGEDDSTLFTRSQIEGVVLALPTRVVVAAAAADERTNFIDVESENGTVRRVAASTHVQHRHRRRRAQEGGV